MRETEKGGIGERIGEWEKRGMGVTLRRNKRTGESENGGNVRTEARTEWGKQRRMNRRNGEWDNAKTNPSFPNVVVGNPELSFTLA